MRPLARRAPAALACALLALSCSRRAPSSADSATDAGALPASASPASPAGAPGRDVEERHVSFAPTVARETQPARPRATNRTARAGEVIRVPAGRFHLGSTPGELGRDPAVEADGIPFDVPAFDIDALPFPNDPAQPARTGATRDEAAALCRQAGRRLCTEIEWERACAGPNETRFPGGDAWDAERCTGRADPGQCASGFGAMVMGTRQAEWTSDDLTDRAVIRGAGASANDRMHRCAARRTAVANQPGLEVAFRCCGGTGAQPPQLAYPRETSRPPFREEPMGVAQLAAIIATIPELARVREGLAIFGPGASTEVMNHGATTAAQHPEVTLTVQPVRWTPTFGEDLLVFTATSAVGSFVAALWVLPGPDARGSGGVPPPGGGAAAAPPPRYKHAASFILAGDRVSMTLAYGPSTREEIQWSACWNCGGEHGVVHYDRDNAHVIAVQR